MKSQTKAFLASVMVLALALSSIGGVTYSWFSDTQTGQITIGTATLGIEPELSITCEEGNQCSKNGDLGIKITGESTATITLKLTNTGSVPVKVSAKVVLPKYYTKINGVDHLVYGKYDTNTGNLVGFGTDKNDGGLFWNGETLRQTNYNSILFGDYSNKNFSVDTLGPCGSITIYEQSIEDGVVTIIEQTYGISLHKYYYDIGTIDLAVGETKQLPPLKIKITNTIIPELAKEMHIEIESTIYTGTQTETISYGGPYSANVDGMKDLVFTGPSPDPFFTIRIDQEAFSGATTEEGESVNIDTVVIQTENLGYGLRVNITFKSGGTVVSPTTGNVTIQFDGPNVSTTISASKITDWFTVGSTS